MSSPQSAPEHPLLLLVDDDQALLNALTFSFETEGYRVRPFLDGQSVLAASDIGETVCLVLDLRLPGLSGLDLLAKLRDRGVRAPAILITTNPRLADRTRAALAKAEIVEKPLLGNVLAKKVREAVQNSRPH